MTLSINDDFFADSRGLINKIAVHLSKNSLTISTTESCTAGLLGFHLTSLPGISAYFQGGYLVYSNNLKTRLLNVPDEMLEQYGAVSAEVAGQLAKGCRANLSSDFSISLTGIAGPGGGSAEKPVGTVWCGIEGPNVSIANLFSIEGDRHQIRTEATRLALELFSKKLI